MDTVLAENDQCLCYVSDFNDVHVPLKDQPDQLTSDVVSLSSSDSAFVVTLTSLLCHLEITDDQF